MLIFYRIPILIFYKSFFFMLYYPFPILFFYKSFN